MYAGIEHRQTQDVYQCLKLISLPGCERIVRYAFEYARLNKRKRVTCVVKDNIMKLSDGCVCGAEGGRGWRFELRRISSPHTMRDGRCCSISLARADRPHARCIPVLARCSAFYRVFEEIGKSEYPDIVRER